MAMDPVVIPVVIRVKVQGLVAYAKVDGFDGFGIGQTDRVAIGDYIVKYGDRHGITIERE